MNLSLNITMLSMIDGGHVKIGTTGTRTLFMLTMVKVYLSLNIIMTIPINERYVKFCFIWDATFNFVN